MDIVKIIRKLSPLKMGIVSLNGIAVFYLEKKRVIYRLISEIVYHETEYLEFSVTTKGILMEMLAGKELVIINENLQNKKKRFTKDGHAVEIPIIGSFSKHEYFEKMDTIDNSEFRDFAEINLSLFDSFDLADHLDVDVINIAKFDNVARVYALDSLYAGIREFNTDSFQTYGSIKLSISLNRGLFNLIRDEFLKSKSYTGDRIVSAYQITNDSTLLEIGSSSFYALLPDQARLADSDFIIKKMVDAVNFSDLYEFEFDDKMISYINTTDSRIRIQSSGDGESYIGVSGNYMKTNIKTDAPEGVHFDLLAKKLQMMLPDGWRFISAGIECIMSSPQKYQDRFKRVDKEYIEYIVSST